MKHVAQVGYATPTSFGNALHTMFIRSMSEQDHVEYDDESRRLTFFTDDEEVWHEDDADLCKLYEEWRQEYDG